MYGKYSNSNEQQTADELVVANMITALSSFPMAFSKEESEEILTAIKKRILMNAQIIDNYIVDSEKSR